MIFANDFDPTRPDLMLSQGELESVHFAIAKVAVLKGDVTDLGGLFPATAEHSQPHVFELKLDSRTVAQSLHIGDDELIASDGSYVQYLEPHLANPHGEDPDDPLRESVMISLKWQLAGTDIHQIETYHIDNVLGMFEGTVDTAYVQNGNNISPNNITRIHNSSVEEIAEHIEDLYALERHLTHDDADGLRRLVGHIDN